MLFLSKYVSFWKDTLNIKKIVKEGGGKNYFKLINIFIFWYIKFFFIYALFVINNIEFAGYILFYSVIFLLLNKFLRDFLIKYYLTYFIFSIFLIFHLLGGLFYINSIRLYDYYILNTIRYDWIIHFVGGFLSAFIAYDFLKKFFHQKVSSTMLFVFIIITVSVGLGTYNEIFEFFAVLFLGADKAVGDYHNNLWDIMNNFFGSFFAVLVMLYFRMHIKIKC